MIQNTAYRITIVAEELVYVRRRERGESLVSLTISLVGCAAIVRAFLESP